MFIPREDLISGISLRRRLRKPRNIRGDRDREISPDRDREREREREKERWNMEDRDAIKFRGIFWNDISSIM